MSRLRLMMAVMAAAAALSVGGSAAADCAAPDITATPRRVSPGDRLSIQGRSWGDACNDTPGPGCNPPPLGAPMSDIHLQLKDKDTGRTLDLITLDADEDYQIEASVIVPEVPAGRYEIVDTRMRGYFTGRPLQVTAAD